jgi:hypothetical protein
VYDASSDVIDRGDATTVDAAGQDADSGDAPVQPDALDDAEAAVSDAGSGDGASVDDDAGD